MLRNKIGFFLAGLINNYNFSVIFSYAYDISTRNPLINPSLVILIEIIPGFITQILYPRILYQTSYTFRWTMLYLTQILSSLFLILFSNKLVFVFGSIALVSINSYLGESTMLSLSSNYQKSDLSLWSMGTGIAGLMATGMYLLLNQLLSEQIIFILNFFLYLFIFSTALFLLNPFKFIQKDLVEDIEFKNEKDDETTEEEIKEGGEVETTEYDKNDKKVPENYNSSNKHGYFFFEIYTICITYFIAYLFGFAYVPLLVHNNFEYKVSQFVTRSSLFFGRIVGNYVPSKLINYFWMIQIYHLISLIVFTICKIQNISIPLILFEIMLVITYFIIGLNYPMIYHYVYEKYKQEKSQQEKYMGSVGQYTAFFTVLGCLIGYPLQIFLK
jgi:hypothetical protein